MTVCSSSPRNTDHCDWCVTVWAQLRPGSLQRRVCDVVAPCPDADASCITTDFETEMRPARRQSAAPRQKTVLRHEVRRSCRSLVVERESRAAPTRPAIKARQQIELFAVKRTLLTYAKKVTVSVLYWYVRSFGTSESLERPRKGSIFFCLRSFSGRLSVFDFGHAPALRFRTDAWLE